MDLEDQKGKEMEKQQERINKFMSLMTEASQATGITYAVEQGQALVVFDLVKNETRRSGNRCRNRSSPRERPDVVYNFRPVECRIAAGNQEKKTQKRSLRGSWMITNVTARCQFMTSPNGFLTA